MSSETETVHPERSRGATSLLELALLFLRLGTTAFGGPAAHIAMMQDEVLVKYKPNATWLVLGGAAAGGLLHLTGWAR